MIISEQVYTDLTVAAMSCGADLSFESRAVAIRHGENIYRIDPVDNWVERTLSWFPYLEKKDSHRMHNA